MSYLLDTNVVSALRVPARNPQVAQWAAGIALGDLFISAFTVAEIELGINRLASRDAAQAGVLRDWLTRGVLPGFAGRVLSFDLEAALIFGEWSVPEMAPADDAQIAAVAAAHGKTIVTRNVRHFERLGVPLLNPWEA